MKICAVCGKEIEVGESYLKVCDNFLQIKYFEAEDESDNVFCSDECLRDALSVIEFDVLEDDKENHGQEKDIGTKYRESEESEEKDRRLLSDADRVCDYSCMGRHHCEGHRMCDICRTPNAAAMSGTQRRRRCSFVNPARKNVAKKARKEKAMEANDRKAMRNMTAEECIDRIIEVLSRDITLSGGPYFQEDGHSTTIIYPGGKDTLDRLFEIGNIIKEYKKEGCEHVE